MKFAAHRFPRPTAAGLTALTLAALTLAGLWAWPGTVVRAEETAPATGSPGWVVAFGESERGKALFTGKGCVVCHSINGVGGRAGPALDADPGKTQLDVFDFAARMWRGASTMIVLQEMELGYQIELSGDDLAHLAAFASDAEAQSRFSESDIPEVIRDWMVDEVYQELDPDYMAK